nr:MAG TPA: hypothetical protein [Caudoviricetes sp.]
MCEEIASLSSATFKPPCRCVIFLVGSSLVIFHFLSPYGFLSP